MSTTDDRIPGNRALRFAGSMLAPMKASAEERKKFEEVCQTLMFAQTFKPANTCHTVLAGLGAFGAIIGIEEGVKRLGDRIIIAGLTKPLGQFRGVRWASNIAQLGALCWMFDSLDKSESAAMSAKHFCLLMDTKARHLEDYKKAEPSSTWTVARPFSAVAADDMHKGAVGIKPLVAPECIDYARNKMWWLPKYLGVRIVVNRWIEHPQLGNLINDLLHDE